jgi:excisionase family DNA binding protein
MKQEWQQLTDRVMHIEQLLEKLVSQIGEKDVGSDKEKPLTLKQAADFLHLSVSRVYSLIYEKKLAPIQRTGRSKILFSRNELNKFLMEKN